MVQPHKMFGRLGNQMFQYATLIALAQKAGENIYFQDIKWFEEHEVLVKQYFSNGIGMRDEVSIHVRRGDYLDFQDIYQNLSKTDYYERAIMEFPKDTKFIVFSDDIEWCKTCPAFQGPQFTFSEGRNEIDDFNLMASCHHNILANSTFSWWAAYLNKHTDKIVICPKQSFWVNNVSLLDNWKQI